MSFAGCQIRGKGAPDCQTAHEARTCSLKFGPVSDMRPHDGRTHRVRRPAEKRSDRGQGSFAAASKHANSERASII